MATVKLHVFIEEEECDSKRDMHNSGNNSAIKYGDFAPLRLVG